MGCQKVFGQVIWRELFTVRQEKKPP
jgi:hypothetical protein